jgi:hypothetical protein
VKNAIITPSLSSVKLIAVHLENAFNSISFATAKKIVMMEVMRIKKFAKKFPKINSFAVHPSSAAKTENASKSQIFAIT